ncbi:MAG: DUF1848 domain-containing protein [Thermoanaerobacteraceae bacterium]|nr:DUF1848 domain-containing protein [Thermoanaerobacteraceae bacterium]
MIISASRRTDIPAFFSEWFMRRIEEGFLLWRNPFNARQLKYISLRPKDVDVIVFWTKNPKPLMKHLTHLDQLGFRYYFQFTLNDYPRTIEPSVPSLEQRISIFQELSNAIGPEKVIWRYDPIIISNVTPLEYHIDKFTYLSSSLRGFSKRVVISFVDMYGKVSIKFKRLEKEKGVFVEDITKEQYHILLEKLCYALKITAENHGFEIYTCSESIDLDYLGIVHGKCVDDTLINKIFGLNVPNKKDKNQRSECLCVQSVDIGCYNTCKFFCSYCYANLSEKAVMSNLKKHKLSSPLLIGEPNGLIPVNSYEQLNLFKE